MSPYLLEEAVSIAKEEKRYKGNAGLNRLCVQCRQAQGPSCIRVGPRALSGWTWPVEALSESEGVGPVGVGWNGCNTHTFLGSIIYLTFIKSNKLCYSLIMQ